MLEKLTKKGRELDETIEAYGDVAPDSHFFQEVQKLERERVAISDQVGKRILIILGSAAIIINLAFDIDKLRAILASQGPDLKPVPALKSRPDPLDIGPKVKRTEITDPEEVNKVKRRHNRIEIMTNIVGIFINETPKLLPNENFTALNLTVQELIKFYKERAHHPKTVTPETAAGFIVMNMEEAGAEYFDSPSRVWLRDYKIPFYHRERRTLLYSKPDAGSISAASEYDRLKLSFIWLALADAWDDLADGKRKSGLEDNIRLTAIAALGRDWMKDFMHTISDPAELEVAISFATNETLKGSLQVFKRSSGLMMTERQLLSLLLDIMDGFMDQIAQAEGLPSINDESYLKLAVYQSLQIFLRMEGVLMESSESVPLLKRMPDLARRVMEKPEMIDRTGRDEY